MMCQRPAATAVSHAIVLIVVKAARCRVLETRNSFLRKYNALGRYDLFESHIASHEFKSASRIILQTHVNHLLVLSSTATTALSTEGMPATITQGRAVSNVCNWKSSAPGFRSSESHTSRLSSPLTLLQSQHQLQPFSGTHKCK